MIKYSFCKNLIAVAIGFFLLLLSACQTPKPPEETTQVFWNSLSKNEIAFAKKHTTQQSQHLLGISPLPQIFHNANFDFGKIIIDGNQASVETIIIYTLEEKPNIHFTTYLVKEDTQWKVDYQRSIPSANNDLFNELFNSLNKLGESFNHQLNKQIPLIEKEFESLGEKLKQEIDNFNENLNKSPPQKKHFNPYEDTI